MTITIADLEELRWIVNPDVPGHQIALDENGTIVGIIYCPYIPVVDFSKLPAAVTEQQK